MTSLANYGFVRAQLEELSRNELVHDFISREVEAKIRAEIERENERFVARTTAGEITCEANTLGEAMALAKKNGGGGYVDGYAADGTHQGRWPIRTGVRKAR